MKQSIFNISRDLEDIFLQIEENGGELSPELEEQLVIKEDELRNKLDSYRRAHSYLLADSKSCKEEETRIATIRKTKEKQAERLKNIMLDAVLKYGNVGKSGNKVVSLTDSKLYTKTTKCVEVDVNLVLILKDIVLDMFHTAWEQDTLDAQYGSLGEEGLLNKINERFGILYPDLAENMMNETGHLFTIEDINTCSIKFTFDEPIATFAYSVNYDLLNVFFNHLNSEAVGDINKSIAKNKIEDGFDISLVKINENQNLIIK